MKTTVRKIVSGGQNGADRAALDFALENGFETGGWIPKSRQAEDGRISDKYPNLRETASEAPERRTELNVRDSDATLIFSHGAPFGGSKLTVEMCEKYRKTHVEIDFEKVNQDDAVKTAQWLNTVGCEVLNVAGSRESEDARIYGKTLFFLKMLLA